MVVARVQSFAFAAVGYAICRFEVQRFRFVGLRVVAHGT